MPVRYEIDSDLGLILVAGSGAVRDDELEEVSAQLAADARARTCSLQLDDWREVTSSEASSSCLRRIAEVWGKRELGRERTKLATVVRRDVDYGLARMYQAFRDTSSIEMRVFRELHEAEAWLGVPTGVVRSHFAPDAE
ncbi:MAG: hypothetical protein QNK03_12210 [Myxococcota bacterium]|nr:hypothetical protein [Myxococcota bacterium]